MFMKISPSSVAYHRLTTGLEVNDSTPVAGGVVHRFGVPVAGPYNASPCGGVMESLF